MRAARVLVVDDRALSRAILRDVLEALPEVSLVGTALNGAGALEEVANLDPDVVLMDVEMPVMDGLTALEHLQRTHPELPVVMVSSTSDRSRRQTVRALAAGAVEFIEKPVGQSPSDSRRRLLEALRPVFTMLRQGRLTDRGPLRAPPAVPRIRSPRPAVPPAPASPPRKRTGARAPRSPPPRRPAASPDSTSPLRRDIPAHFSVLAVGTSTGGPAALGSLIPALPANLTVPVVVVQHMPPGFTAALASQLDARSPLEVREAKHGDVLRAGLVLIAPGGQHMEVVREGAKMQVRLHRRAPVRNCRPSVDVLFESLALATKVPVLSVIMTGMGDDGSEGVRRLAHVGGYSLAQDQDTCVVDGMPRAVAERGLVHEVLPIEGLAARARELVGRARGAR